MAGEKGRRDEALKAFELLRVSAVHGVKVIPLIGAGVSIAAGVPPLGQITEHLIRIYRLMVLKRVDDDPKKYLLAYGWPGRHALNAELHAAKAPLLEAHLEEACKKLVASANAKNVELLQEHLMRLLQIPGTPSNLWGPAKAEEERSKRFGTDWLLLLLHLADREQGLIDSYLARLVRRRAHATPHQFVAFLTKIFNWNPILTTNFDDLIESALRSQGINPVVFELARDMKNPDKLLMPDEALVRAAGTSVIKLHGGTHGLCAGYDLNQPLPKDALDRCCSYLPDDAVFLVLGYGATEKRVMSLLKAHHAHTNGATKIVWVYRTKEPDLRQVSEALGEATLRVQAEDPGLFLHELHQRILFTHPAGLQTYSALHYPPSTVYKDLFENPAVSELGFTPPQNSPRLGLLDWYNDVEEEKKNSIRLWFSLREFPTLSSFVSTLIETLQAGDRGLPVAARPCIPDEDGVLASQYIEHIRNALIRYPYRIAVDAYRAFLSGVSPEDRSTGVNRNSGEQGLFDQFLEKLVGLGIGESRWAVALDPAEGSQLKTAEEPLLVIATAPARVPNGYQERLRDACIVLAGDDEVALALLQVAVAFRRPRSLAGLAKVTASLLRDKAVAGTSGQDSDDRFVGSYHHRYSQIVKHIEAFQDRGLFVHHDGGFYSIYSGVRSALAKHFSGADWQLTERLQNRIADYYCAELYEHSKDPRAFFEYAFHRVDAARSAQQAKDAAKCEQHLSWLVATVEREADVLFAQGQAPRLLHLISYLEAEQSIPAPLRPRLARVKAAIYRRATAYEACRAVHLERLSKLPSPTWGDELERARTYSGATPNDTLEIATHCLEIGACFNAQGWPFQGDEAGAARNWLGAARALASRVQRDSAAQSDVRQQAAVLVVRSLKSSIKLGARTSAPWEWLTNDETPNPGNEDVPALYREALELLRSLGPAARLRGLQCSVRCSFARHLYLQGLFGKANVELNRAHAFGARSTSGESWDAVAEYHLHRAEYCLYRALRHSESPSSWLLDAAATALSEAEDSLRRGDRSAASWLWFYLQRAWLSRDRLRTMGESDTRRSEEYLLSGLVAVAGARVNLNVDTAAEAAMFGLWTDLREQWFVAAPRVKNLPDWDELNLRAGLGPLLDALRPRRAAPRDMRLRVGGNEFALSDVSEFGIATEERIGAPLELKDAVLKLSSGHEIKTSVRCCHPYGGAIARITCEQRRHWIDAQKNLKEMPRNPKDRGKGRGSVRAPSA